MFPHLHRLALAFVAAFLLMALGGGYWALVEQDALLARADNPRRILLERRFPRGAIYDRNGVALAESIGAPGALTRNYPYPPLSPVLGYVSPLYGLAGVEAAENEGLHGAGPQTWWDELTGVHPAGRDVRLTLDLRLQAAVDEALGPRTGAVVLLDAVTGEILALASHPGFNSNTLEDDWPTLIADSGAPLLNRATSTLYQPGGAMQPFLLAAALQSSISNLDSPFVEAGAPFQSGPLALPCRLDPHGTALTLAEAFRYGCPQPFAALGEALGARRLEQLHTDLRLLAAPDIGLPTLVADAPDYDSELAALGAGQGSVTVTPLHLALATSAIARRGQMPAPQLLLGEAGTDGEWLAVAPSGNPVAAFAPATAEQVKALLRNGHVAVARAGAEGRTLAWYLGFAPFADTRYTVAVLLEDGDTQAAEAIGLAVLKTVQVTP
jgi:peptidoglycan glycosyltransferase